MKIKLSLHDPNCDLCEMRALSGKVGLLGTAQLYERAQGKPLVTPSTTMCGWSGL